MKKIISLLLMMALLASVWTVSVFAVGDNHADVSRHIPVVAVRVNGTWFAADLTQYKGQSDVWVEIPIDRSVLNAGQENYFSLRSNVNNTADFSDGSVDLYSTAASAYTGSFLCTDPWLDNGYVQYTDRTVNMKVQVYANGQWQTVSGEETPGADHHTVLGQLQGGDWYNAARNIVLSSFSDAAKARVLVNLHVGKDIEPLANYAGLENYEMNQMGFFYSNDPILRVRVNGTWYGVGLEDLRGQENTWAYCPIDLSALKANDTNYVQLSSNVKNAGNLDHTSLDLYFTDVSKGDSFLTNDQWCDNGWGACDGKTVNARIELYDGRSWVPIPGEETYHTAGGSTVIGLFAGNGTWYNFARNISLGDVDLSKFQGARIAVNVHVGADVDCDPFVIWDLANFREPTKENPLYTVAAVAGTGGTVTGAPEEAVLGGTQITLTAIADDGYTFAGWYRDGVQVSDQNPYVFSAQENVTLEARFNSITVPTYTVTVTAGTGGTAVGGTTVNENTQVTVTAAADAGYAFDGWYLGDEKLSSDLEYSFTVTEDVALEARFVAIPAYTITVTAGPGGNAAGSATVLEGAHVTVTATAGTGFTFDGWYCEDEKVSGDAAYTFAVTKNVALEARFTEAPVQVQHKQQPETPDAARSSIDDRNAAIKVRVNGAWFGRYVGEFEGQTNVWVPVYIDIAKLNANSENYFNLSSNVISYGNYTDSSIDLFASAAEENLNSFLTGHQWCDEGWVAYTDRNINIKLQLFNGTEWVTVCPEETSYCDEHTVLGKFDGDGNYYNAARNFMVGDLSGYTAARVLVNLHIGTKLDAADDFSEETFGMFLESPEGGDNPKTGDAGILVSAAMLVFSLSGGAVLVSKRRNML